MFRVTPVYGSRWSTKGQATEPQCVLIEYANARLLCNVGWWVYSPAVFPELPEHDALLVTDSTTQCAGGLPLYHLQHPETPVYATFPTVKMGQMTLYDQHAALTMDGKRPPFTLEEVDQAFGSVTCIKYSQSIRIKDLSVTAHRAGHVVGGAFFVLFGMKDETSVVVTSNYHIAREIHLDSSTLLEHASTADVLVTYPGGPAFRSLRRPPFKSRTPLPPMLVTQAERNLTDIVLSVLRREGNVLLPVDAAGRVLELALLLDRVWERQRLSQTYNLVWVAPMVANTVAFAKCQLEWMARQLTEQFDSTSGHPFQLRNVFMCSTVREFEQFIEENQNPTCVLASGLCLEGGPARDIFFTWASNPDHAVIFTDSSQCYLRKQARSEVETDASAPHAVVAEPGADVEGRVAKEGKTDGLTSADNAASEWTTAAQLLSAWFQAKVDEREMDDSVRVDLNVPVRSPLVGAELVEFLAREDEKRRELARNEEKIAMLREVEIAKGQLRLEEKEVGGVAIHSAERSGESASSTPGISQPKKKKRFDSLLFFKYSKPQHLMFRTREEAVGVSQDDTAASFSVGESSGRYGDGLEDDYGISVVQDRFTDIVSGVDPSKFSGDSGRLSEDLRRRGLGYGTGGLKTGLWEASSRLPLPSISDDEGPGGARKSSNRSSEAHAFSKASDQSAEAFDLSEGSGIVRSWGGRPPMKVSTIIKQIDVLAEISFIPLEGRVDSRSARQSVRALQPRQVIVLGGPKRDTAISSLADEVNLLAEAASSLTMSGKTVHTPSDGETIELPVGHAAYAARIIHPPDSNTAAESSRGCNLGHCVIRRLDTVATGQRVANDGSTVLSPVSLSESGQFFYLSDGEVLLLDLRSDLIASGMKAEYSSHAGYTKLVVNGKVVVKRFSETALIEIGGPVSQDFFIVRSLVCGLFSTL